MIDVNAAMWTWIVTAALAFALGVWIGGALAFRSMSNALVRRVRGVMNADPIYESDFKESVRELRTIIAIDGHQMPKHVRDAAVVWLAEQEHSK